MKSLVPRLAALLGFLRIQPPNLPVLTQNWSRVLPETNHKLYGHLFSVCLVKIIFANLFLLFNLFLLLLMSLIAL